MRSRALGGWGRGGALRPKHRLAPRQEEKRTIPGGFLEESPELGSRVVFRASGPLNRVGQGEP